MVFIYIPNNRNVRLEGDLTVPEVNRIIGIILFAHGSGSGKNSPRNQYMRGILNDAGFATLLMDLLTQEEQEVDVKAQKLNKIPGIILNKFNIALLAKRLVAISEWLKTCEDTRHFKVGYFGASTGAAAAIEAAAALQGIHNHTIAIVSRGARPDLASTNSLRTINAATMFIVGDKDSKVVIDLNKKAFKELRNAREKRLMMIPGAGHLFEEPGSMTSVGKLAVNWFLDQI